MYTNTQPNRYPNHQSQFTTTPEHPRSSYPPAQSYPSYSNSNVYSDPGSFSAIGAAYGFNPDQPIQIPPQHLHPTQNSMMADYHTDYNQLIPPPPAPPQQQLFSVPMHNPPYQQAPNRDWTSPPHIIKRRRYGDDSEEEDPQFEAIKRRPKREDLLKQIREQESVISDLRARLDKVSIYNVAASPENVSSPPEIQTQTEETNQYISEDVQIWIREAKETAHSKAAVGDLEPNAVNAVEASDVDESEEEDHLLDGLHDEAENSSNALSPSANTDGGHSSTTKTPVVGNTLHPIGFIARNAVLMGVNGDEELSTGDDKQGIGIAHPGYFRPGMSTDPARRWAVRERQPPPKIFSQGLVTPREVDKLFEIYFDRMNLSVSLLDPKIYTAQMTYWRSPFLFTVICAIASRYLVERPGLYHILMSYAKVEAGQALISGLKSPELVAGYILLSLYPVPSTTWEEDRGWLMLGVAIRMATDLNLHHSLTVKATTEQQRREVANRTRIWINCYNLDRSTSTQFGKPSTIKHDYIASHSKFWYKNTDFNYDIHLNGYTQLLIVMANFHEAIYSDRNQPTGLNKSIDFEAVTEKYEQQLLDHWTEWEPRFAEESDNTSTANAYSRLVILSFRFQNAFQNGLTAGDPFLQRCIDTASSVVKIVVENMAPHPFLRTAPDAQFVFASFASVFLLKLLRPRFSSVLEPHQKESIINLVKRLIDVLGSDEVAIDERHTPKLYAKFLTKLLDKHVSSHWSARSSSQPSDSSQPSPLSTYVDTPQTLSTVPVADKVGPEYPRVLPPSPIKGPSFNTQNGLFSGDFTLRVPMNIVGTGDIMMDLTGSSSMRPGDDMLASMRAVENPAFWDDAMLPGFSWAPLEVPSELYQAYPLAT
ncbi:hypothetical protein Clacol_002245 [Clathrus columnatus]|uniref:Xylanolytic transcriptional activator regulatory domain-containing protein n=1 Tax=Clathrus columnatus TaxID=1419009 RepID=A0AAV5A5V4_9AGAM|nr:hypothetical protein Clacol_002245 [Clathrus columnatus]